MAKEPVNTDLEQERLLLEERKVRALEKIAVTVDALTLWFEDIDKEGWGDRIQFYLYEGFNMLEEKYGATKKKK